MVARGHLSRPVRLRAVWALLVTALVFGVAGEHRVALAHTYCEACIQWCKTTMETGCEVYYPNTGAYTKGTCNGGGTSCSMTFTTSCHTMKKLCSQSVCSNNDCQGGVCTTYTITLVDAAMSFSGSTSCAQ